MLTAIALVVLAVVCRMSSPLLHTWNLVPMGAVALYAGSRLPRGWAWLVPVAAMILSDIALDYNAPRPFFELTRWVVYVTFAVTSLIGPLANLRRTGPWLIPFLSLGGSTLFFLTSNLATWAEGRLYPLTSAGLFQCYAAAIPFFEQTVLADLVGVAVLFGLVPVLERAWNRPAQNRNAQALEAIPVTSESGGM
jgi:hypothetical protein